MLKCIKHTPFLTTLHIEVDLFSERLFSQIHQFRIFVSSTFLQIRCIFYRSVVTFHSHVGWRNIFISMLAWTLWCLLPPFLVGFLFSSCRLECQFCSVLHDVTQVMSFHLSQQLITCTSEQENKELCRFWRFPVLICESKTKIIDWVGFHWIICLRPVW